MKPLFHPTTEFNLDTFLKRPSQTILLHGPTGIGLGTAGLFVAESLAQNGGTIAHITPESNNLTIEQIRELYINTRTKAANRRVIVLHNADTMLSPAQNAFLKLLEEPTDQTYFVLLAHSPTSLLPTIHSRLHHIELLPLETASTGQLLVGKDLDEATLRQILFVAPGLPAEISRLSTDESYRTKQFEAASTAKQLISAPLFERLSLIQKLANDRTNCLHVLRLAARMLSFQLMRRPTRDMSLQLDRLQTTMSAIQQNGNLKAQLLRLLTA